MFGSNEDWTRPISNPLNPGRAEATIHVAVAIRSMSTPDTAASDRSSAIARIALPRRLLESIRPVSTIAGVAIAIVASC